MIGGASLAGGRGHILNTVIGAMTIVIVQNGLNLNAVPTSAQNVIIGAIIVLAVGIDMWRERDRRRAASACPAPQIQELTRGQHGARQLLPYRHHRSRPRQGGRVLLQGASASM